MNIYNDYRRYLNQRELAPLTIKSYIRAIGLCEKYIQSEYGLSYDDLPKLKAYMFSNYISTLDDKAVTTRAAYIGAVRAFLTYLYDLQYVDFNMSRAMPKTPNVERHHTIHPDEWEPKTGYTKFEIQKMLDTQDEETFLGSRNRAIILTLAATGLRASELCALTIHDVANAEHKAKIPRKGTHEHKVEVLIPKALNEVLSKYLSIRAFDCHTVSVTEPLFISRTGAPLTRYTLYHILEEIQRSCGLKTGVHRFRHTALTEMSESSSPIVARDIAGQKNLSVTNRYLHATEEQMRDTVETVAERLLSHE